MSSLRSLHRGEPSRARPPRGSFFKPRYNPFPLGPAPEARGRRAARFLSRAFPWPLVRLPFRLQARDCPISGKGHGDDVKRDIAFGRLLVWLATCSLNMASSISGWPQMTRHRHFRGSPGMRKAPWHFARRGKKTVCAFPSGRSPPRCRRMRRIRRPRRISACGATAPCISHSRRCPARSCGRTCPSSSISGSRY